MHIGRVIVDYAGPVNVKEKTQPSGFGTDLVDEVAEGVVVFVVVLLGSRYPIRGGRLKGTVRRAVGIDVLAVILGDYDVGCLSEDIQQPLGHNRRDLAGVTIAAGLEWRTAWW
jgi:hypothetical protein